MRFSKSPFENVFFEEAIYLKNRLIVLCLKHNPFVRICIRLQTIYHTAYENAT